MANLKISELTAASALVGSEVLPIVQSGQTVKTTVQDISNLYAPVVMATYQDFYNLLIAEALVPGTKYEVPYRSVNWLNGYTLANSNPTPIDPSFNPRQIHVGEEETLIVEAISTTELASIAYSKQYPTDIIHYLPYANKIGVKLEVYNGFTLPNATTVSGFDLQWDGTNVYFNMPAGYPAYYGQILYLYCDFTSISGDYAQDGAYEPLLPNTYCQYPYTNNNILENYPKVMSNIKLLNGGQKVVLLDLTEADYNNYVADSLYIEHIQALGDAYGWIIKRIDPIKDIYIPFDFRAVTYRRYEVNTATFLPTWSLTSNYIGIGDNWSVLGTTGNYIDFKAISTGFSDSSTGDSSSIYFEGTGGPFAMWYTGVGNNVVFQKLIYSTYIKPGTGFYNNSFINNIINSSINAWVINNNVIGTMFNVQINSFTFNNNIINTFNTCAIAGELQNSEINDFSFTTVQSTFNNVSLDQLRYSNIYGSMVNITGYGIEYSNFYANIGSTSFSTTNVFTYNNIKSGYPTSITANFTTSTHVYQAYTCDLFFNSAGTLRLSYINGSDVLTVVAPTA